MTSTKVQKKRDKCPKTTKKKGYPAPTEHRRASYTPHFRKAFWEYAFNELKSKFTDTILTKSKYVEQLKRQDPFSMSEQAAEDLFAEIEANEYEAALLDSALEFVSELKEAYQAELDSVRAFYDNLPAAYIELKFKLEREQNDAMFYLEGWLAAMEKIIALEAQISELENAKL